eukprot:2128280-Pleurochrysis_carterae.AAC.3
MMNGNIVHRTPGHLQCCGGKTAAVKLDDSSSGGGEVQGGTARASKLNPAGPTEDLGVGEQTSSSLAGRGESGDVVIDADGRRRR